jgi:catechol 2,3-dioxygenase-like lactoylglutathione lyase family enzyme
MAEAKKARAVGFNHVALEVGNIEEALAFYGRLFDVKLRGKHFGIYRSGRPIPRTAERPNSTA